MTEVDKRAYVAALYSSKRWKQKVAGMPETQVVAIYMRELAKAQTQEQNTPKEADNDDIPL